jgi:hypothetical protein
MIPKSRVAYISGPMAPRRNRPGRPQQPHQRLILPQLQWSHDEGVVEVGRVSSADDRRHPASMGPRRRCVGSGHVGGSSASRPCGLNGATTMQSGTYDAATNTVILVTAKPLNPSRVYQVAVGPSVGPSGRRKHNAAIGDLTSQTGNPLTSDLPVTLTLGVPTGGNLVDLAANPFLGFIESSTSFNVSNHSPGPPHLAPYTRPSTGYTKYSLDM